MLGLAVAQRSQAANQNRHLRCGQVQHVCPIHQLALCRLLISGPQVVAEAVGPRFEQFERLHIGLLLRGVRPPLRERHRDVVPGILGRLLDRRGTAQHDQVGERNLLPAGGRAVEIGLDLLQGRQHGVQVGSLVDLPILLRRKTNACAVSAASQVGTAEAGRRRPRCRDQLGDRQTRVEDLGLEGFDVLVGDQCMVDGGNGILPQLRLGNPRTEVARDRPHVAVQQLVPRLGERLGHLLGVVQPAPGDRPVDRVHSHRDVSDQHRRRASRSTEWIGDRARAGPVFRRELPRACRALGQFPLIAVQGLQEGVVPRRWCRRPDDLEAAGDRVLAHAGAERALPAEALQFEGAALGFGTDEVAVARAVGLADRVAPDDERCRLLIVHRHATERLADVLGGSQRIRLAFGALRVHVDQTHGRRAEGIRKFPVSGIALVGAQPGLLFAEEDFLGFPDVFAPEAEAERLQPHGFVGAVAREDDEVGPRDLLAVLLLERPEQPARLVQADIVGPAVNRGEALCAFAAAAAAVGNPVGACGVPAHPDEQSTVVAVVGRPPVLRSRHQLEHVALECLDVELAEFLGVVEGVAHRVGLWRMLLENGQVHLIRPPVLVPQWSVRLRLGGGDYRVFALRHVVLLSGSG